MRSLSMSSKSSSKGRGFIPEYAYKSYPSNTVENTARHTGPAIQEFDGHGLDPMTWNTISLVILTALLVELFISGLADILNLNMSRRKLPDEFVGLWDTHQYDRSRQYLHVRTRFRWIVSGVNLSLLLGFWFAGGFPLLDEWVRSWNLGPVPTGMAYIGVLGLLSFVASVPFSLYGTFVIEERFGFNRTTLKTFVLDRIKGLALALILGAPLLAGILTLFQAAGSLAWLYGWLSVTMYMLVVQFVAPTWIMPLFNRFAPLEEGELKGAILDYARSIQFPLENIFVMDGSRRSGKSNAFFTGFGKHKRIALFDTLIRNHTVAEIVAILAHEMGHYKKKHILKSLTLGILQTGLMFFLLSVMLSQGALYEAFSMQQPSIYSGLVFFAILMSPLELIVGIFTQLLSRRFEYAADRFSVRTTRDSQAMIDALKKLSVHNLTDLTPHPFYVFLNHSHPPVLDRIRAIAA